MQFLCSLCDSAALDVVSFSVIYCGHIISEGISPEDLGFSQKVTAINNMSSIVFIFYKTYVPYPHNYYQSPWTTEENPRKEPQR